MEHSSSEEYTQIDTRYVYFVYGAGCRTYSNNHFQTRDYVNSFKKENTLFCCFPERELSTIATRIFNIGEPLKDILELQIETKETAIPLMIQIIQQLCDGREVFLFGHSFGGLIVNRICEEINKCIINEDVDSPETKEKKRNYIDDFNEIYKTHTSEDFSSELLKNRIHNLAAASFGSIYLSIRENTSEINLINYMYIGDVAIRCNFNELIGWNQYFGEMFGFLPKRIPNHDKLDRNFICKDNKILFRYNSKSPSDSPYNVIFLNKYVEDEYYEEYEECEEHEANGKEPKYRKCVPITDKSIKCDFNLIEHGFQWKIHKEYYHLIPLLLQNVTNDINKINGHCNESIIQEYDPIEIIEGNTVLLKTNNDDDDKEAEEVTVGGKSRRNKKSKGRKMKKRKTKKERRIKRKHKNSKK
jgi:hypothetical protein